MSLLFHLFQLTHCFHHHSINTTDQCLCYNIHVVFLFTFQQAQQIKVLHDHLEDEVHHQQSEINRLNDELKRRQQKLNQLQSHVEEAKKNMK